jgi:hypothetical protein
MALGSMVDDRARADDWRKLRENDLCPSTAKIGQDFR